MNIIKTQRKQISDHKKSKELKSIKAAILQPNNMQIDQVNNQVNQSHKNIQIDAKLMKSKKH